MSDRPRPERDLNAFEVALKYGEGRENEFAKMLFRPDVEVKSDVLAASTGNVFVEYAQGLSEQRPAGIATSKSQIYVIEIVGLCWVAIETARLRELARRAYAEKRIKQGGDNGNVGVLVPVDWLVRDPDLSRPQPARQPTSRRPCTVCVLECDSGDRNTDGTYTHAACLS